MYRSPGLPVTLSVFGLAALFTGACAGESPSPMENLPSQSEPSRCSPGPGATGNPHTVVEVVDLINSLPAPVTIPCFLQSLTRPLEIIATPSILSAQPAAGAGNPRLFILRDGKISLSVVADGEGKHLLEMGELTAPTQSIKAELEFPIPSPLPWVAPFQRVALESGDGTVCRACHGPEEAVTSYPVAGAMASVAFRPRTEVDVYALAEQSSHCDAALEPERCAFFEALFGQGQVSHGAFPPEMGIFGGF